MDSERIALIDMDGTLADYTGVLHEELEKLASPDEPPVPEDFHEGPDWLKRRAEIIKKQHGFWRNLPKVPEGFQVLQLLQDLKYEPMILTKGPTRTTSAWTEKRDWCHEHLPGTKVTITEDKGLVYGKVLFDDFPPYILRWLEWRPRGKVIMLEHPWNYDFKHEQVFRFRGSKDLEALRKWLQS